MTTRLLCELVGGPHDGLRFTLDGLLRSFPSATGEGTTLHIPDRLLILLGDDKPKAVWEDSIHLCTGTHPPLSVYTQHQVGDTRYQYTGPFPCAAAE